MGRWGTTMAENRNGNTFRASGQVVDQKTHDGLPNMRVEAWDSAAIWPDVVAVTVSGEAGEFSFSLDDTYLQRLFHNGHPTLFFRVFRDDRLLLSTEKSVLW